MARKAATVPVPLQHRLPWAVSRLAKPSFVEMVNPGLVTKPPTGPKWAHEIKWDGSSDGRLRHPSSKGFRDDLGPGQ